MSSENTDNQSSVKKDKPEEKILNYFKILYNSVIILGATLCILYFGFTIKASPNISEISQIINYVITIAGVAIVLIFIFSMLMLLPSILFSIDSKLFVDEKGKYDITTIGLLLGFPFFSHAIFVTITHIEIDNVNIFLNHHPEFFILYYLAFGMSVFYFFTKKYRFSIFFTLLLFIAAQFCLYFIYYNGKLEIFDISAIAIALMIWILLCILRNSKIICKKLNSSTGKFKKIVLLFNYLSVQGFLIRRKKFIKKNNFLKPLVLVLNIFPFICLFMWINELNIKIWLILSILVLIIYSGSCSLFRFKWIKDSISAYSFYTMHWLITFGFVIIYFVDYDSFEIQLLSLIITSIIIVLINTVAFKKNITLFPADITIENFPYKEFIKYIFGVIAILLFLATLLPTIFQSTNTSLLEKVFSISGFGNYSAKLQFKEDYISKANPFLLNESNQTINTFEILSNLGKEYIIKEKYPLKIVNKEITTQDANMSNKAQKIVFMNLCWDKYENIGKLDKNTTCPQNSDQNLTKYVELTSTKQLFDSKSRGLLIFSRDYNNTTYWFSPLCWTKDKIIGNLSEATYCQDTSKLKMTSKAQKNYYIYRINKDNVINEITGEEPNKQTTMWVIH